MAVTVLYAGEGGSYNFINNYYKPGPFSATKGSFKRLFTAYADDGKTTIKQVFMVYSISKVTIWILPVPN